MPRDFPSHSIRDSRSAIAVKRWPAVLALGAAISLTVLTGQMASAFAEPPPPVDPNCLAAYECESSEEELEVPPEQEPEVPPEQEPEVPPEEEPEVPPEQEPEVPPEQEPEIPPETVATEPSQTLAKEPSQTITTETITTKPDPAANESTGGPLPLLLVLVLALAGLLSAGLFIRARSHRGRPPSAEVRVAVKVRPGSPTTFETRPSDELDHDHVLAVVPAEIQRSTTVEENQP